MFLIVSFSLLFGGYAALWKNLFDIEYLLILVFFFSVIVFIFFTEYIKIYLTFLFFSLFGFIYVTYDIFIFESELIKWQVALNRNDKCIVQVVNVVPNVIKKQVLLNIVSCGEYVFRKKVFVPLILKNKNISLGDISEIDLAFVSNKYPVFIYMKKRYSFLGKSQFPRIYFNKIKSYSFKRGVGLVSQPYLYIRKVIIEYWMMVAGVFLKDKNFAVVVAILFGLQNWISYDYWQVFKDTSTAHLLAISGLHVQFLAMYLEKILLYFVSLVSKCFPLLYVRLLVCIFLFMYATLAGFSISCIRALSMYIFASFFLCNLMYISGFNVFSISLIVVFIYNSLIIFSPSFILSYAMTFSLLLIQKYHAKSHFYKKFMLISVVSAPWSYLFWRKICFLSPFYNVVAIAFLNYVILPFAMLSLFCSLFSIYLTRFFLSVTLFHIDFLYYFLRFTSFVL